MACGTLLFSAKKNCDRIPVVTRVVVLFHDAGGGHRNAATALQAVIAKEHPDWTLDLVQFQQLTDRLDVLRRVTGIRIQEQYNKLLEHNWTLGSVYLLRLLQLTIRLFHRPLVRLLEDYWRRNPADAVVSVIPHFNRQIAESWHAVYPERPFVTILTDFADFPPRFWIEPTPVQRVICGTSRAIEQARSLGKTDEQMDRVSGMILRPEFYEAPGLPAPEARRSLGLEENVTTGMLLFGGYGSKVMYDIARRLDDARLPLQLIAICGRNEALAERLRARRWNIPIHVIGFTREVHKYMEAADFLIGKPGPGSITEAVARHVPVLVECNAWTLPQERYNAGWVTENRVGIVLPNFRHVVDGVRRMIDPAALAEFTRNTTALENRAVFEIPAILGRVMKRRVPDEEPVVHR
jgi:1,2-diacylglycerol 3-beta-galactosyltransferase